MTSLIKCKNCGTEIEVSEALTHQIEEQIVESLKEEHKKEMEALQKEAGEKAKQDAEEKFNLEFVDLKKQLAEKDKRVNEFREKEISLRDEKRKLEEREKDLELKVARTLDEERKKIEADVEIRENEKHLFKEKEKDKQIDDLRKALDEAQRKASTAGSQQLQGEVMELDLEERLIKNFPHDLIDPVAKGVRGGDILQTVRNSAGKIAGTILWETKRANWTPSWLTKLRDDAHKAEASTSILVTEVMPKDIKNFGFVEGVLVTSYSFSIPLAVMIRRSIMQVAAAKSSVANKDEKLERLYGYLQSDTFRHRFEAYAESIVEMQQDLDTEKRSIQRSFKKREMQIGRALDNISDVWGELQGIMGSALQEIKILSLPDGKIEEE